VGGREGPLKERGTDSQPHGDLLASVNKTSCDGGEEKEEAGLDNTKEGVREDSCGSPEKKKKREKVPRAAAKKWTSYTDKRGGG